ncbi:hypothetical protein D8B26_008064 [Coccidioides posadasii str. Silveira]|uniref:Aminoglycoside phosphotransferase domain-containing protein n=3 Tax=Coccidioides posadasii TaxID=199306 RepID=E9DE25_COCPS|nr:Phosphotransferase family protein [Coccidioides posadasii C735 delta SOWgp]EER29338.1 Phosphotransferase family protein [Coccidioides posadasii C735 delta SOWgp]EFW15379.1 conserved hypothetical protein [Coccidioides posadasii str. Silveira]KMM70341.1 hypothetical protein CPAG_06653 [Coccidioides posadasii RMSCC 3488]QVM13456.1 hypothetical protein D8B26_008064 [Coccidioides posadasii str. Silveira]|eukprot:XP_003071483.1 Phosphotransferase family protein [Coccidioides posadasii C735 delta SOWgp]
MATPLAAGVPYCPANLREDEWYIRVGKSLFPLAYFADRDVPLEAEQIHVLRKQMGSVVVERDSSYVTKFGGSIRRSEEHAMMLVAKHTSVPVPRVFNSDIRDDYGQITMSIIPGKSLDKLWASLNEVTKLKICRKIWGLLAQLRSIPRPPECDGLFQCSADGSSSTDPLLEDLGPPPHRPILTDEELRARIYERYIHFGGRLYEHTLPDMLPRSSRSVFTHADIAPRNIMVDKERQITGILDWEFAGWYPDYWEYTQMMRPGDEVTSDWQRFMDLTAPEKWDLSGVNAVRKILF